MRTVFYDFVGTAYGTFSPQVSYALFGHDDINVMLCRVNMTAHRDYSRNFPSFGGALCCKYADISVPFIVTAASDTVHQLAAADMAGVFITVYITFYSCIHGNDSQSTDDFR